MKKKVVPTREASPLVWGVSKASISKWCSEGLSKECLCPSPEAKKDYDNSIKKSPLDAATFLVTL